MPVRCGRTVLVLQMLLHLLDPTRDRALVNKSDSILTDGEKIPDDWWDPVPYKGLTKDSNTGKWNRPLADDESN